MKISNKPVISFAVIDTNSNEWLFEGASYRECLVNVPKVVGSGREYVIVAILREGHQ